MDLIEDFLEHNIVFNEQLSHLTRGRMQELINIGGFIERIAENIDDDIFAIDFSKLINRPCINNFFIHYH